jgi:hypothetical protein
MVKESNEALCSQWEKVSMKRTGIVLTVTMVLSVALLASVSLSQGRGAGRGRGAGMGMGRGAGAGCCNGQGQAAGAGGWWTRVAPKTTEQKAFVDKVTRLHASIRALNVEIATLRAKKAPQADIDKMQAKATTLRTKLAKVTNDNAPMLKEMGVPAGCGVCDGTGPKANCPYAGQGRGRNGNCPYAGTGQGLGRGNGMGLRDGTGPNPNCPLKK